MTMQPDYTFADALLDALARALRLTTPDEAAGLWAVLSEVEPTPEPEDVTIPFGCVTYAVNERNPKIVPQMYVAGKKLSLGHFPYTKAGAEEAARVREAAVRAKADGANAETIKALVKTLREAA